MKFGIEVLVSMVALSVCTGAAAQDDPVDCVEDTKSVNVYWPAAVDLNPEPVGIEYLSAEAYEHDTWTKNDPAGRAVIVPDDEPKTTARVCLEIRNFDGFLFGPNNKALNGGTEKKCIEVFVVLKYRYKVKYCTSRNATLAIPGAKAGATITECYDAWVVKTTRTKVKEVCPCE